MEGGGDVEARPERGPIGANYDPAQRGPWKWTDTALLCLLGAFFVGMAPCGAVVIKLRRSLGPGGVPSPSDVTFNIVFGSVLIVLGLVATPVWVVLVVTELRRRREVEAMTRLHVVPVSR
jgi:hypothetical protein